MIPVNSFDLDGVVIINGEIGVRPGLRDIIITGRSIEEAAQTLQFLKDNYIENQVFFNPLPFDEKTRESSGFHKGRTIANLMKGGMPIRRHFEDDEVQIAEIERYIDSDVRKTLGFSVIHISHDLTEKENVWCGGDKNELPNFQIREH